MSWKSIFKLWVDRTTCGSECHRPHSISYISLLSEKERKKLRKFRCRIPFENYVGSIVKEGKTVDVYAYEKKVSEIRLLLNKPKEKKENEIEEEMLEEESWEQIYTYSDMDYEEENC